MVACPEAGAAVAHYSRGSVTRPFCKTEYFNQPWQETFPWRTGSSPASARLGRALAESVLAKGHKVIGTVRQEAARAPFEALAPGKAVGGRARRDGRGGRASMSSMRSPPQHGDDRRPRQQRRLWARRRHRGGEPRPGAPPVRGQCVRRRGGHAGGAAAHAQAAVRPHRQHHLDGRPDGVPRRRHYTGSKFALEGLSEAWRRKWSRSASRSPSSSPAPSAPTGRDVRWSMWRASITGLRGDGGRIPPVAGAAQRQAGRRSAQSRRGHHLATEAEQPPLHLLLGPDALRFVGEKLGALQTEMLKWALVSASTNFDDFTPPKL